MSRWGKPIKNKKHKDPRYFLHESIDLQEQSISKEQLKKAKMMLDNGSITQDEFNKVKQQFFKSMDDEKAKKQSSDIFSGDTSTVTPDEQPNENPLGGDTSTVGPDEEPIEREPKSPKEQLKKAKMMLDKGLITQDEFNKVKQQFFKSMDDEKAKKQSSDIFSGATVSPDNPEGKNLNQRLTGIEDLLKQLVDKIK